MKYLFVLLLSFFFLIACSKGDRKSGVCYCDFANGQKQEYDLTHLTRQQQIDTCNNHDKNAANFGGHCQLE